MGSLDVTGMAIVLKSLPTFDPLVLLLRRGGTFFRRKARRDGGGMVH